KKIFQEYLTNQGTVVKPYFWQRQNNFCARCPYHIRTGEEARVPHAEFHQVFLCRPTAALQNKHLLFYELRSFSGTVVQKGHATNCTAQDSHAESMLFEAGGYLDAVADAHENIRSIILYSNYSPCNEAYHCCVSKIYNFLLRHPDIVLCICFSQLYRTEDSFPTAIWNRAALQSLSSLWPRVTLQRLPEWEQHHLLCNFVSDIPGETLYHPALLSQTSAGQLNPHQINNFTGMKLHCRKAFPRAMQKLAVHNNLKAFYSPDPASQQSSQAMKGSLPPPMTQSHLVLLPGMFPPFQREHQHPRPKNIVRHLKMPKE
ncbi:ABEC4 enzyme, partial [Turnix velox]|nr:ABEC4 enzyme [Turnix velox]